ncbi:hypothetical protein ABVK25_004913 [Lepraria finkii]|uniref:EXPERA domain-containing protein n=1 Tax=Lepraria finkii TaxID=1340010 RepID=A0ABR4BA25_9LECA
MAGLSSQSGQPQPIWSRKTDMFYIVFLFLMIFLALALDFVPFFPVNSPPWATTLYTYYRTNCNDPLYAKDQPFFRLYIVIEAVYSVPTCIWAIRGLIQDDKMIPVHLLVFATHLVTSTAVCFVEVLGAKDWPREDVNKNLPGYVIFFAVAIVLWADMFSRVKMLVIGKTKLN